MTTHDTPTYRMTRRHALAGLGATISPLLATGTMPSVTTTAQDATPASPGEPDSQAINAVQYQHPEKVYFYLPGMQDETVLAGIHGLDVATWQAIRSDFETAVHHTAMELLADDEVAASVDALPIEPGSTVVAIGESDTDDLQSWFEILRHLVTMQRPDDGITFVNQGISGQNTAQALGQVGAALAADPAWILCLLGGNDVLRNGPDAEKTEVSIEEAQRNLAEMRRLAAAANDPAWVWLTRPPIDEVRAAAFPGFQMGNISFRNDDVERINDFISSQPDPVIDVYAAFGDPSTELLGPDGVHASLAGQAAIARAVVTGLAE